MMGDAQYRAWGNLADTVQTGDNAYEKIFGKPIFDHLAEQPEKARIFDDAMTTWFERGQGSVPSAQLARAGLVKGPWPIRSDSLQPSLCRNRLCA